MVTCIETGGQFQATLRSLVDRGRREAVGNCLWDLKIYFSGKSMIKLGQAYNVIRLGKLIPSCSGHNQQNTGVYKSAAEIICLFVFVIYKYYQIHI